MVGLTYNTLYEKFKEKGRDFEFYILVPPPPLFDPPLSSLMDFGKEYLKEQRERLIKNRYMPEWEYWNTWIDYQQYKF